MLKADLKSPFRQVSTRMTALFGTLFTASSLLLSLSASAEPNLNWDVFQGAKAWYDPGFSFLDTTAFNGAIANQGYNNLSNVFISQGGGAHLILDRIILGGSGMGLNGFRSANAAGDVLGVSGGYGLFNLGYMVYQDQNFNLYPVLGIGSGHLSVSGSGSLNKVFGLSGSEDVSRIDSNQVVLDIGIGADYLIDFNADSANATGLLVGLKLGYLFVPSPTQWEANRRLVGGTNLPNLSNQGLYFNLILGAGTQRTGFSERQKEVLKELGF